MTYIYSHITISKRIEVTQNRSKITTSNEDTLKIIYEQKIITNILHNVIQKKIEALATTKQVYY